MSHTASRTYEEFQDSSELAYRRAWSEAPESFKQEALDCGVNMDCDGRPSDALPFEEGSSAASYTPDMADTLDEHVDGVIEKHGGQFALLIRSVADDLKTPMILEIARNRALLLGRVVTTILHGGRKNMMARIHGLLHCLPGLAEEHGYFSLSKSATACGVSRQWMTRSRDGWCHRLCIPIPALNKKSPEAINKYRVAAIRDHWRRRAFTLKSMTSCTPKHRLKPLKLKPIPLRPNSNWSSQKQAVNHSH